MVPRSVTSIFKFLEEKKLEFSVKISSMELYNEGAHSIRPEMPASLFRLECID